MCCLFFITTIYGFHNRVFHGGIPDPSLNNGLKSNKSRRTSLIVIRKTEKSLEPDSNKNRANVNSRLHVTTETAPLGIGKTVASVPNRVLAQGKRQIWANTTWAIQTTEALTAVAEARKASLAAASVICENPEIEFQRYNFFCALRQELGILVKSKGVNSVPPLLAFERWQFECKTAEELQPPIQEFRDPLFPQVPDYVEPQLVDDLCRIGLRRADAADVAGRMMRRSCELARSLSRMRDATRTSAAAPLDVVPMVNRHNVDLRLGQDGRVKFKVNHEHIAKLRTLWANSRPGAGGSVPPAGAGAGAESSAAMLVGEDAEARQFRHDLFRLLARYQARLGVLAAASFSRGGPADRDSVSLSLFLSLPFSLTSLSFLLSISVNSLA